MVMPNIMQGLSLEIFLLAMMGYIWLQARKNRGTVTLFAFSQLCSALMLFLIIDIPVRLSDLQLVQWSPDVTFWLNALYIGLEGLTVFEWFLYFLAVLDSDFLNSRFRQVLVSIPLVLMIALLVLSYRTGWLFYVDENGAYTRGSMFFLQFLLPYSYFFASFITTAKNFHRTKNRRTIVILVSAFATSAVASLLQVLFSGSFTHAGLCFAVLLVYLEMFQEELKKTDEMKALSAVNRKLALTNDKLNETIRDLETAVANEQAASNAKNEFLARMSHDIRTPLNGILGLLEINDKHPEDTELLAANRKKGKIAANHLLSLINDILDMSKLSSGKYELAHETFSMPELLDNAITMSTPRAATAGIALAYEAPELACPITYGSPLHINRILLNLIGNAIKYNKKNGSVTVGFTRSFPEEGKVTYSVTVADTGIGMSKEFQTKMFEPFAQERIDEKSVHEGTGLGMAITKALVDAMGGTLSVESEEGKGSTFTVELTFEIAPDTALIAADEDDTGDLSGIKILLAEDNELNVEIATELLTEVGAEITVAENGRIALEKFSQSPAGTYDVILMDCMMPIMNGFDATRAIRALERPDADTIPIIAMTANAFADDVKKCLEAGMNDHIPKPFELARVIKTVRRYA